VIQMKAVPTLADLQADPGRASELPLQEAESLLSRCHVVQGVLLGRLLALRASDSHSDKAAAPDRLLDVEQAALRLGKAPATLYKTAGRYPFTVRDGRTLRFSAAGIEKYIRARTG